MRWEGRSHWQQMVRGPLIVVACDGWAAYTHALVLDIEVLRFERTPQSGILLVVSICSKRLNFLKLTSSLRLRFSRACTSLRVSNDGLRSSRVGRRSGALRSSSSSSSIASGSPLEMNSDSDKIEAESEDTSDRSSTTSSSQITCFRRHGRCSSSNGLPWSREAPWSSTMPQSADSLPR